MLRRTLVASALVVLAVACGGTDVAPPAVVEVLDTTVERGTEEAFVVAATGDELAIGDIVRTDADGFGQIDYADGSLARLGPSTSLAVVDLSVNADDIAVELELDEGQVWNRVAPDGGTVSYEIATVVGTAAVRGTTFDVSCQPDRCTFTVFDGVIELSLPDGDVIELVAPRSLEVVAQQPPAEPRELAVGEADSDVWWARNRAEDVRGDLEDDGAASVASATVPGSSNLWLAGMPEGTQLQGDTVPDQAPVLVEALDLEGGRVLRFAATGSVSYGGGAPSAPPDGELRGSHDAANGIGASTVGWNALIGVFLDDQQPDEAGPAPAALDFSSLEARDPAVVQPALRQPFFIGDGVRADGSPHDVEVPAGATRLYLGTVDGFGWFNNTGAFEVTVAVVDPS